MSVLETIASLIYEHELVVPISAIPIIVLFRVIFSELTGSMLILSLSLPSLIYPLSLLSAQDVRSSMMFYFAVIPAMWVIPLIATASFIRLLLVMSGRWSDSSLSSRRTIGFVAVILLLYGSVWYETHLFKTEPWS